MNRPIVSISDLLDALAPARDIKCTIDIQREIAAHGLFSLSVAFVPTYNADASDALRVLNDRIQRVIDLATMRQLCQQYGIDHDELTRMLPKPTKATNAAGVTSFNLDELGILRQSLLVQYEQHPGARCAFDRIMVKLDALTAAEIF